MPAANPPRWITVRKVPYDYHWPGRSAMTSFGEAGEYLVKAEVADDAVGRGFASEGKADGSEAKSTKGKRPRKAKATRATKSAKPTTDAGTNAGKNARVGGANLAADDSAGTGEPVAPAAE